MYNAEGEFINPYCRLSYAPRPDPLAPEITDFKSLFHDFRNLVHKAHRLTRLIADYLARAVLQRGPAANSAVEMCISAELRTHLMAYA
ncbi:hypothetical protein KIN20_026654 [Parelaphostrongylus tenuis]|uniref:Uncharacterized protein n=1 Tax=Parelaphostrongylus tenuis TaxID=148309 RepID=A0AAD5QY81_PARTN|nr:hypothetical protein KIN20_026654 [Parelaphostrongylus tenuis]